MMILKLFVIKIETSGFRHFKALRTLILGYIRNILLVHAPPFQKSLDPPLGYPMTFKKTLYVKHFWSWNEAII